jgi:hypothetical protein
MFGMVGSPPHAVNATLSPSGVFIARYRPNRLIRLAAPLRAKDRDTIESLHTAPGDAQTQTPPKRGLFDCC